MRNYCRRIKTFMIIIIILCVVIYQANGLMSECGIQFCSSCNPNTNFCYQCQRPYKPGYANQSVCTRCANNCAVCETQGTDSKGVCLSCEPNYDFSKDNKCDIFYIWIYVVVIAAYAIFVIILFITFCYIKRRKQKQQSQWFQKLKCAYNQVNTQKVTVLQFDKMCQYLIELLKESSSYNNLKFKDREFQKAMRLKKLEFKTIKSETHMKKVKMTGYDNSEWEGYGYVFIPQDDRSKMKLWFVKNYKRKVFSESISKVVVYESEVIESNLIEGRWYYYGSPDIGGSWRGVKQNPAERIQQPMYVQQ